MDELTESLVFGLQHLAQAGRYFCRVVDLSDDKIIKDVFSEFALDTQSFVANLERVVLKEDK